MFSIFLASMSLLHYITAPVVDMREMPDDSSEIVSQAYFSEEINIIEEAPDWLKIETVVDHYQGWIKNEGICNRKEKFPKSPLKNTVKVSRCMAHLYHKPSVVYGPMLTLPFDSLFEVVDECIENRWVKVILPDERFAYIQRGDVTFNNDDILQEDLALFSLKFAGLPYTWGGRSSFGYDCSGFVQMLYRQIGIHLPRDSKDQANYEGLREISIDELSAGDLIFFGLSESQIRHVGMYLGNNQFIHATVAENAPYIHVSYLSDPEWNSKGKWPYRKTCGVMR